MVEKDFFHNSQNVFRLFRIWSHRNEDNRTLLAYFLKWMTIIGMGFTLGVITLTDAINEMQHGESAIAFSKGLYFFIINVYTHKIFSAAFADNEIYNCINQMEVLSRKFKNKSDIEKNLNLYRKLFMVGLSCVYISVALFMAAPLTTAEYRPLPFRPHYIPFLDVQKSPSYQLIYLIETVAVFSLTSTIIAYDTLFCGMMCVCSAIISSICREIREFENFIEDHQMSEIKMKEIIDKINEITQLTSNISDTFSMTTMAHMIYNCNTIALGLFMITVLPVDDVVFFSMISVTVLVTFQLWIYCYFGQDIVSQREDLLRELCFIRWYDASPKFKTMLLLTIFESQNDRYVYAGKVVPLSLETFTEVIKKGYAFFTFMNESR